MIKLAGLVALAIVIASGGARAGDVLWGMPRGDYPLFDEWAKYFQRIDTITVDAGDARNVNAVTHIITPWPYYARNRWIPANGQRMVGAIDRYQNPRRLGAVAPTLAPIIMGTVSSGGGGGGGAGAGGMAGGGGAGAGGGY
jgi:uncharacterized membrane protein YgcG